MTRNHTNETPSTTLEATADEGVKSSPSAQTRTRQRFRSPIPSFRPHAHEAQPRTIEACAPNPHYATNAIKSAKYTWYNMIPKAIFEQFRRLSNFYFLIVAAVSFIPNISPSSPVTTTLPLVVVIGFGLARDLYEDFLRKRADAQANNCPVLIRNRSLSAVDQHQNHANHAQKMPRAATPPSASADVLFNALPQLDREQYSVICSCDVSVGDVVVVANGMAVPADLALLASANISGDCFVSTANLDGESNLKRRRTPMSSIPNLDADISASASASASVSTASSLTATVTVSPPTPSLYEIEGTMLRPTQAAPTPLDDRNVLLRGSILRNTPFIHGVVLYTGRDTKLALNMRNAASKLGGIERMMNRIVVTLFIVLLLLTTITSALAGVWQTAHGRSQWYMGDNRLLSGATVGLRSLGTFIILYHTFVPVSLFVTLEFVRLVQGWFITGDVHMTKGEGHADVKANNLNECLGYVDHIFSDKTGTLTQNEMRFIATVTPNGKVSDLRQDANEIRQDILSLSSRSAHLEGSQLSNLMHAIAITHDVSPAESDGSGKGNAEDGSNAYQGESVDEIALVQGAHDVGVKLQSRSDGEMVLKHGECDPDRYTILTLLEFSSERKRMSVIVRREQDGTTWLFSKGADSVMLPLLAKQSSGEMQAGIDELSRNGLRTLVFGRRQLGEEEFVTWRKRYEDAANAMTDRTERKAKVAMEIERDLDCVGVTGVEDKLQDNVGNCISFLRMAGIRIWVVTGDKVETAENIGYSTMLLNKQMKVTSLTKCKSGDELEALLQGISAGEEVDNTKEEKEYGLIIDGETLKIIETSKNPDVQKALLQAAMRCKTVICARVTPLQKANVVKMVRRYDRSLNTLAIGDGGNDVSMIQEAHIGIGIKGKEGSQAARAADYSLMEFKHLQRLLAIHGRYSYVRTAGVINLSFYKNVFFSCTQFFFQFYCFASGTTVHNQWIVTAWNSILTLIPPFFYGIFERDIDPATLLRFPVAYDSNRRNRLFNLATVFEFTIGYSTWHATALFFLTYFVFGKTNRIVFAETGHDAGFYLTGLSISFMALSIALFKFLLCSHLCTRFVLGGILLSFALLWGLVALFPTLFHELPLQGVLSKMMSSSTFHLLWPLVFVVAFMPDFLIRLIRSMRYNIVETLQLYEIRQGKQ